MKEQGTEKLNALEGTATLAGVRSDNISHEVDPTQPLNEVPRFPENPQDKEAMPEDTNPTALKGEQPKNDHQQDGQKGSPLTVDMVDITGKTVDEYYKENNVSAQ